MDLAPPPVRYTTVGELQIAFQVVGEGPRDLMVQCGFPSHLEIQWEPPAVARFFHRLASFSRLILFDRRGSGLSERGLQIHGFEDRMDDIRAVLDAVGSERIGQIGVGIGGRVALLFAATYPERTEAVATIAGHPATFKDEDYPWGTDRAEMDEIIAGVRGGWDSTSTSRASFAPPPRPWRTIRSPVTGGSGWSVRR